MTDSQRSSAPPPSARRLLIHFMAFGVGFALVVVLIVAAVLMVVRDRAEDDVDTMLRRSVQTQLSQSASQQADVIQQELLSTRRAAEYLADAATSVYLHPVAAPPDEVARFEMMPDGAYVTRDVVDGAGSMMYTGAVPIGAAERQKAADMVAIDPALKAVVGSNPLAVQAYINTWDSLNRIYPGFEVVAQYPEHMDIPKYAFYYEADLAHNPTKEAVWTTAYVDPAGQGWMTSAIAPVYVGDTLEAVVGVDVTVKSLVGQLLSTPQSFGAFSVLLDGNGTIIAMPRQGEDLFGLTELTDVDYQESISEEIVKPEEFDVDERADTAVLASQMQDDPSGTSVVDIGGTSMLAAWHTFEQPGPDGWRVLTLVSESQVQQLHAPGERMKSAAITTLWIVAIAFLLLVVALTWRARQHSLAFTRPLEAIDTATARIAAGDFEPTLPPAPVAEIARTGEQLLAMGHSLQLAQDRMIDHAEALREGEQRYRAIFENVADPIVTIGPDGRVIDANDAANEAFGRDLAGADVTEELGDEAWRTVGRRTLTLPTATGEGRLFEVAVTQTGDGDDVRYTVTAHDVTAEAEARELMTAARETAERTALMKDEFLASMSHEIRTPLNGVIGVLSLMAERDLPEGARRELAVARRSADDLLVLVNDVLDFAKIEADQVSVVTSDVRLVDVLEGVRQLYTPFASEQRNELLVEVDPALPEWVHLDPTRVRQVLVNLVSNALKFTDHGMVVIAARADADGVAADETFALRLEVRDNGIGIAPEVQERLFTRFTQGDPLATRKFPGTGLGLAIVKRLAELMGGEVGLQSTPGEGSTFWFTVRAGVGAPTPTGDDTDPGGVARTGSLRVLVAEDNEVNRYLICAILDRLGHEVTAVVNGREAVEAAQRAVFDLVLMDVQMPVANGIDATHAIRALPGPIARVPILAVTANVLPEQQAVYRQEGFTGWVPKPLTLEQVEQAIATVVPHADRPAGAERMMAVPDARDRFDRDLIEQYRSVIGPNGAREMVDLFLQTLVERRAQLGAAVAVDDLAETQRIGHALKGMASAVGAVRLSAAGAALQHAEAADVPGLLTEFDAEAAAATTEVRAAWGLTES